MTTAILAGLAVGGVLPALLSAWYAESLRRAFNDEEARRMRVVGELFACRDELVMMRYGPPDAFLAYLHDAAWEPLVWPLGLIVGVAAVAISLHNTWSLGQAKAIRTAPTFTRFGDPVRLDVGITPQDLELYRIASALKAQTAPYELWHSVNTYSPSNTAPPALPAPVETVGLVPLDEWLGWVNDPHGEPHLMISGKTNAGKSTVAETLLAARIARGDEVYIIDPHYQPVNKYGETTWCGLEGTAF